MQGKWRKLHGLWYAYQKNEGGLNVLNIQTQNEALLLKHLDKFFNKRDLLWVKLIWDKHYRNGKLPSSTTPRGHSGGVTSYNCWKNLKEWQVC
jgi:hypothetical protein